MLLDRRAGQLPIPEAGAHLSRSSFRQHITELRLHEKRDCDSNDNQGIIYGEQRQRRFEVVYGAGM